MSESSSRKKLFAEAARVVAIRLSKQQGTRLSLPGLAQTTSRPSQILPRLYLGDYWHVTDEAQLRTLGVTHVVSVMEERPSFAFAEEYGASLKNLHIPLRDSFTSNILKHLDRTTEYIREALSDTNSILLVHCFQGISRSATIVAAYLLASSPGFVSAATVLQFLKEKRSIVSPNQGFVRQLDEYATVCLERRSLQPGTSTENNVESNDKKVIMGDSDVIVRDTTRPEQYR